MSMGHDNALPQGWVWTTLEDVTTPSRVSVQAKEFPTLPYIGLENVASETMKLISTIPSSQLKSSALRFFCNNVLYGRLRPYLNKVLLAGFDGLCSPEFLVFSDYPNSKYLQFFLNSWKFKSFASHLVTGDRPRVDWDQLKRFEFPLAPLPEQHRIVAVIEQQFSRLDESVATLQRDRQGLKRARASVLKYAVEGKLTEQWRAAHPTTEPASKLLQRILDERRAKWEAEQLTKMQARGVTPKDDTWKREYKEPVGPDTSKLPELPEGWCWATAEQVSVLVTDGDHNPPTRVASGVPHLTAKNIMNSQIDLSGCTYISEVDAERVFRRYKPLPGDLIITCVGTIGRTAIVPEGVKFSPDRNLAAVRTVIGLQFAKFLEYILLSPNVQEKIMKASGSTAQPHLYLSDLRVICFPLPPLAEQEQIVAEVEERLSVIEASERAIEVSLKRIERLRQDILQDAFAGRLAPQDPADEPASVLLERIREERARREQSEKAKKPLKARVKSIPAKLIKVPDEPPEPIDATGVKQEELW